MILLTMNAAAAAGGAPPDFWDQLKTFWPLIAILIGVLGALVGVGGSLMSAAVESKREHRRWLRERRYEAYVRAFALIQGFSLNAGKVEKVANRKMRDQHRMSFLRSPRRRLQAVTSDPDIKALDAHADRLFDSVADVLAPIQLLGPLNVSELAVRMQLAYEAGNEEEFGASQRAFLAAAEKVLGIDGGRS